MAPVVDVAFRLRRDTWQGETRFQLELVALRPGGGEEVVLRRRERHYHCRRQGDAVVIRNAAGEEPCGRPDEEQPHPYLRALVQEAAMALGLSA